MLPVNPSVPSVPPDPPPVLLVCMLSVQLLSMNPLLAEVALSSSLTTSHVSSFLQLISVPKPRNLVSCVEHDSLKSPLRDFPYYQQEVVEILVARFLGLLTTDCKLTSLHGSSFQVLEDWTSKVEILAVVCILYAVVITSAQPLGVQFSTAIEDVTNPLSFRFKLPLPQYEDATLYRTRLVYLRWWFTSQQSIFWKRRLGASELVENFLNCSANGTWIVNSALRAKDGMPQEAPHSILSSGPSSLQILSDFIIPFFALRTGLDLIEITGYFVRNLVHLVTPLSCSFNICTIFVLIVVVYAMGAVPKLWCS
ncbi:hypothetical protein DY000_02011217 [Brassica cretica]|uniref:Uncharacterized protein n=1 Tax=Brassica cretica TaxID=69181 RepID=A0ABQ7D735_BRACR|nr:hypothetical protein DY000_02011217 [Brassica cretica]